MTGICPYACGFDPYDLTCDLNVAKDRQLPLWRRIVRVFTGRYDCLQFNGELPCERYDSSNKGEQMNDTHGETGKGWYGFDLDGTLAKYDGWKGIDHIGEPVKPMVELIKRMHDEGKVVKIMTARIAPHKLEDGTVGESYITVPDGEKGATRNYAHQFINDWCHFNLGFIPEIVYRKDHLMLELYDDRVKQVVPNEGWLVEDIAASKRVVHKVERIEYVDCKWYDRFGSFMFGMLAMLVLFTALILWRARSMPEAVRNLDKAVREYQDAQLLDTRVKDIFTKGGQ